LNGAFGANRCVVGRISLKLGGKYSRQSVHCAHIRRAPSRGPPIAKPAYKRDSVSSLARRWRSSLCDLCCHRPDAAYPGASSGQLAPCLTLLRAGLAEPRQSPAVLVGSYPTVPPLPAPGASRMRRRAAGGTFSVALSPSHPGWALPTALPYGVPTFLDTFRCRDRPAGSAHQCSGIAEREAVQVAASRASLTKASARTLCSRRTCS